MASPSCTAVAATQRSYAAKNLVPVPMPKPGDRKVILALARTLDTRLNGREFSAVVVTEHLPHLEERQVDEVLRRAVVLRDQQLAQVRNGHRNLEAHLDGMGKELYED